MMRKFMALLGVGGMLTILPATPAFAQVIDTHEGICHMVVPDADGGLSTDPADVVDGELFIRTNKSWTTMTCHFNLTAEQSPDKAVHASGFPCAIPPLAATLDSRVSASAGGRMVLTCRVKN